MTHIDQLLAHLPEPDARLARLADWLETREPKETVPALAEVLARADQHDAVAQAAILTLVNVHTRLSYERSIEIYVLAGELGHEPVKRLFFVGPAQKALARDGIADNEFLEKTLGERKALAATSKDRNVLDRLMRDRHPHVIAILLKNSRITERDVVRIAAQAPLPVPVIEAIVHHHTWLSRYAVKKALVFNPYTPKNLASSLLLTLLESDRREARRLLFERDEV